MALIDLSPMYRVMILFMLNKTEYPLTNTQITNFILDRGYTDYFSVQQTLYDLLASGLIVAESTHSNTRYRITEEGAETLALLDNKITDGIKQDILSYFREHRYELKREASVYADFYRTPGGGCAASCQIKDGNKPLIDLTLHVATAEQAKAICQNWLSRSENVYALLMDELLN